MIIDVLYKAFLDLQKAYVTIYRDQCMDVLVEYGI